RDFHAGPVVVAVRWHSRQVLTIKNGETKSDHQQNDDNGDHLFCSSRVEPCTPQKHRLTSGSNFFQPVFMLQPAENILDSDPANDWQLVPLTFRSPYWLPMEIWDAWPQARVWSSLVLVGNPLPQDRPKMFLTQGDQVVQALPTDGSY